MNSDILPGDDNAARSDGRAVNAPVRPSGSTSRRRAPRRTPAGIHAGATPRTVRAGGFRVSYADHGDPAGDVVFLLHGTPSSRLGHEFTRSPAERRGLRVICPDRPGIGHSDHWPGRTIAGYAEALLDLADALRVERFAVLGYSGGSPYALSCAAGCGPRLTATALMAGIGPLDTPEARQDLAPSDRQILELIERSPAAARLLVRALGITARLSPRLIARSAATELSAPDRAMLAQLDPHSVAAPLREALAQGPTGILEDYRLCAAPWNLDLSTVTAPVHLFHGDADHMVPLRHATELHHRLPRGTATLHQLPDVGHISIRHHIDHILDTLQPVHPRPGASTSRPATSPA